MSQRRFSDPVEEQDIAASADRSEGDRYRTAWRIDKVMCNGDAGLWRVSDIYGAGLMQSVEGPEHVGAKNENALSDTGMIRAVGDRGDEGGGGGTYHGNWALEAV